MGPKDHSGNKVTVELVLVVLEGGMAVLVGMAVGGDCVVVVVLEVVVVGMGELVVGDLIVVDSGAGEEVVAGAGTMAADERERYKCYKLGESS